MQTKGTAAVNLVPLAFPALTSLELELDWVLLGEPGLALLQQCSRLSSLSISGYGGYEETPALATAVAQLSSLRDLTLWPFE
jgi:hypothetical protein